MNCMGLGKTCLRWASSQRRHCTIFPLLSAVKLDKVTPELWAPQKKSSICVKNDTCLPAGTLCGNSGLPGSSADVGQSPWLCVWLKLSTWTHRQPATSHSDQVAGVSAALHPGCGCCRMGHNCLTVTVFLFPSRSHGAGAMYVCGILKLEPITGLRWIPCTLSLFGFSSPTFLALWYKDSLYTNSPCIRSMHNTRAGPGARKPGF